MFLRFFRAYTLSDVTSEYKKRIKNYRIYTEKMGEGVMPIKKT